MAGNVFRNRLISKIRAAMAEYKEAGSLGHSLLKGRVREIAVQNLFDPLLSPDFRIGTGTIIDAHGKESGETDVIVYSSKLLPPILYSDRFGTFPIDACLATVEVKSELTARELRTTLGNARKMPQMKYTSGIYDKDTQTVHVAVVTRTLFAFSSDAPKKDELERYKEHDSGWASCPLIKQFCVVGKGTWSFDTPGRKWYYEKPTAEHEEVVSFLTSVVDQLIDVFDSRGHPKLRNYVKGGYTSECP